MKRNHRRKTAGRSTIVFAVTALAVSLCLTSFAARASGQPATEAADARGKQNSAAARKGRLQNRVQSLRQRALRRGISPRVVTKLSEEELYTLLQRVSQDKKARPGEAKDEQKKKEEYTRSNPHQVPRGVVAVVVPVVLFLCILGAVIGVLFFRTRKDKELQITLRAMVEKGAEIPPELITPPAKKGDDRRKGILLLTVGLGFSLCMAMIAIGDPEALKGASVGLVPVLLGVGYLIVARLEKRDGRGGGAPTARREIQYSEKPASRGADREKTDDVTR